MQGEWGTEKPVVFFEIATFCRVPFIPSPRAHLFRANGSIGSAGRGDQPALLPESAAKLACHVTASRHCRVLCCVEKFIMAAKKRELLEPHPGDKRFIRRDALGRIKESADVGRSLTQDRKRKAKSVAKPGQGDHGDRKPAKRAAPSRKASKSAKASPARRSAPKKAAAKKK